MSGNDLKLNCAQTSLSDLINGYGRRQPSKIAFIEGETQLDWAGFNNAINHITNGLRDRAIGKSECVGLLANNSIWAYCVMFGVVRSGGVSTALSTMLSLKVLINLIDDAGLKILFIGKGFEEIAEDIAKQRPELTLVKEAPIEDISLPRQLDYDYLPVTLEQPFSVTYSSGTTGVPKGVIHSHIARLWFAYEIGNHFDFDADSVAVVTTPPYSNGTNICLLPAIYRGATMVLLPKFDAIAFCDLVERHSPSHTFMVPTQFQALLNAARAKNVDWDCFRALVTAGAPMPSVMRESVLSLLGPKLAELWGLTEGVGCSLRTWEMAEHAGTVGRIASGSDIRLIDDKGQEVLDGAGEIVGRSAMLMDGYLNRPDATEAIKWTSPEGMTYLRTGDIGEFDEQGYLWIRGRIKDMIISGGFNVYPIDIEGVLSRFSIFAESAVIGIEDAHWGEVPVAVCVLPDGVEINLAETLEQINKELTKPQRLKEIVIQHHPLPRNALGKVLKNELIASHNRSNTLAQA